MHYKHDLNKSGSQDMCEVPLTESY